MAHIKINFWALRSRRERAGGFTLIEVMVVVAIVAILAAVALPSYSDYIQRSKISEAISNLSDMRTRLEQYYLDNRAYPAAPANCIAFAAGAAPAGKIYLPAQQKYFSVTCSAMSTTAYTILATGVPAQGMSASFTYTIDQANNRRTTGLPSNWPGHSLVPISCWAIRKDGSC